MDPSTLLQSVLSRADDWRWVGGVFAAALAARFLPRIGPAASGLLVPAGLLLLRKLFLFLPIPGTLSTADRVVFWSTGAFAYVFFLGLCLLLGAVVVRFGDAGSFFGDDGPTWVLLVPAITSAILLPVDGFWSHMIMPFVCAAAIPKVLLVHPLLLPLALAGLAGQLCLTLFCGGHAAREVNKLLLCVLLAAGVIGNVFGIAAVGQARSVLGKTDETKEFLSSWARDLEDIAACGANLVEENHQSVYESCQVRRLAQEMTAARSKPAPVPGLLAGAALGVLLLALLERIRWPGIWRDAPRGPDEGAGVDVGES